MNKNTSIAAGLIASAMLMMAASPAMARVDVGINIGIPGLYIAPEPVYVQPPPVYVQSRPVYIEQDRESEWRERNMRAHEWRERQWQESHYRDGNRDDHHDSEDGHYRHD